MYIRTSFVCSSLHVSSIRIYILIDGLLTNNSTIPRPNPTGGNFLLLENFHYHVGKYLMPIFYAFVNNSKENLPLFSRPRRRIKLLRKFAVIERQP